MKTKTKTTNYDEIAYKMLDESQAKDDIRFSFNGIFYDSSNNCTVSTDGRRVCVVSLPNLYKKEFENKIIRYTKTGFIEIDGNFPNYKGIMPPSFSYSLKMHMPVFDKKQISVNFHINSHDGHKKLAFSYEQKDGYVREFESNWNIMFKTEFLNTISGHDVIMYWNSESSPIQFKLLNQHLEVIDEITYLVMPMRK